LVLDLIWTIMCWPSDPDARADAQRAAMVGEKAALATNSQLLREGLIAADMVRSVITSAEAGSPMSENDALAIVAERWGVSQSTISKIFQTYKPVAHLWAALQHLSDQGQPGWPCRLEDLGLFLALSMHYVERASAIEAENPTRSLLDPASAWIVPPELQLPELQFVPAPSNDT
jgi:hypothetical protein